MGTEKEKTTQQYRLNITENGYATIDEISDYIANEKFEPISAVNVVDRIFEAIDKIPLDPFIHSECEEIPTKSKMYRKVLCMSWWIVYRIKKDEVIILGVVSTSRSKSKIRSLRKIK
ncbi:hypothetical protein GF385_04820 [Candidatus Dependentiae bacterium]|nr:hypothetical protein [Candidatus Dependentiae bacterium]